MKSAFYTVREQASHFLGWIREMPFGRQLAITVTCSILLMAGLSSILDSWEAGRRLEMHFEQNGIRMAEHFASQSRLALVFQSADNADEAIKSILAYPDVEQVHILQPSGKILVARSRPGAPVRNNSSDEIPEASKVKSETDSEWIFAAPVIAGTDVDSPFDVRVSNNEHVIGFVEITFSKSTLHRLVLSIWLGNMVITLSVAAILLVMMRLLTGRILRPLKSLSGAMHDTKEGKKRVRAQASGPRDIAEMSHVFNDMMAELETRETLLRESRDKALQTALMKTQFAAMVSHEVRTPLNSVIGMLELTKGTQLTDRQREYIDVAWRSAHSLVDLVEDVLQLAKMEAGKLELDEDVFDLRRAIEDVVDTISAQANVKRLDVGYILETGVPETVIGDALKLRQVLLNLLGNAVKFTERGELAVRVSVLSAHNEKLEIQFKVSDTGIGIESSQAEHIFDSYSQAERTTSQKYGGTGLGLAISKSLVELMRGTIHVDSIPGHGSTFTFTIRVLPGSVSAECANPTSLTNQSALIYAQSAIVRQFVGYALAEIGVKCVEVRSVAAATGEIHEAKLSGTPFDMVILDVSFHDARSLARLLSTSARGNEGKPKVIGLDFMGRSTSHGEESDGVVCVNKPLRKAPFLSAIFSNFPGVHSDTQDDVQEGTTFVGGQYRVLVVDDNMFNRNVMVHMLENLGCRCMLASSGVEAVESMSKHRFDLVFMDCLMPKMDGMEASSRIRHLEASTGRRTPIIALTANTSSGTRDQCYSAGMDDYLSKPVTLADLQEKLLTWIPGMSSNRLAQLALDLPVHGEGF